MRLSTKCHNCAYKIFISSTATERQQLPEQFELTCLHCGKKFFYTPYKVIAELGLTAKEGAFLGGLIGLVFGGAGALAGAILGGALGKSNQDQDEEKVRGFNES